MKEISLILPDNILEMAETIKDLYDKDHKKQISLSLVISVLIEEKYNNIFSTDVETLKKLFDKISWASIDFHKDS